LQPLPFQWTVNRLAGLDEPARPRLPIAKRRWSDRCERQCLVSNSTVERCHPRDDERHADRFEVDRSALFDPIERDGRKPAFRLDSDDELLSSQAAVGILRAAYADPVGIVEIGRVRRTAKRWFDEDERVGIPPLPLAPSRLLRWNFMKALALQRSGNRLTIDLTPQRSRGAVVHHERVAPQHAGDAERGRIPLDLRSGVHDARVRQRSPGDGERLPSDRVVDDLVMIEVPGRVGLSDASHHDSHDRLVVGHEGRFGRANELRLVD